MNTITILGRLTKDPENKTTQSGKHLCTASVAVQRPSKGSETDVDYFDCVAWEGTGDFISRYFSKGDPIAISGRMQFDKFTDKQGNSRIAPRLIVNTVSFVPKGNGNQQVKSDTTPAADVSVDDDDLPF